MLKPSFLPVVAANLVPLIGALFFGWDAAEVAFMYWLETAVIGVMQLIRMIVTPNLVNDRFRQMLAEDDRERALDAYERSPKATLIFFRLFIPPFFAFHYGFFIFIQGSLLFALLNQQEGIGEITRSFLERSSVQTGLGSIALGHLTRLGWEILVEKNHLKDSVLLLLIGPYKRIFIQQLVVIIGAPLLLAFQAPAAMLALLIGLKTWVDFQVYGKGEFFWVKT